MLYFNGNSFSAEMQGYSSVLVHLGYIYHVGSRDLTWGSSESVYNFIAKLHS